VPDDTGGAPIWHNAMYGTMEVVGTDQFSGRLYRCACGWQGWSVWGRARKHAELCAESGREVTHA
jgi:hypothetical protein